MKKSKLRGLTILMFSIALLVTTGCEGPEGPQGPEGTQGPQGEQGPQGPLGTANVIYSDWISFNDSNWNDPNTIGGQTRREYPVSESQITNDILANGTVAVYARFDVAPITDRVFPLPFILPLTSGSEQQLAFELEPSTIIITLHDVEDNTVDPGTFGSVGEYRYIIIPGGTPAKAILPDLNDYYAVIDYYGIDP